MKIRVIDFGAAGRGHMPRRAHHNDAGADVFAPRALALAPQETAAVPLGFGLELPDGLAGYVYPRGSLSRAGLHCSLAPIDPGYRGEAHCIITNLGRKAAYIEEGSRIAQLVVMPAVMADFVEEFPGEERGAGAFGSTGA
jgi:dUTP pyrophosphatase